MDKDLKNLYMTTYIDIEISVFYTYQSNAAMEIYSRDGKFHTTYIRNKKKRVYMMLMPTN